MVTVSIDKQTVEDAKRELINQLKSKIKQACVEAVYRKQYGIETIEGYDCKDGDIDIDNDQVAFKLDFEVCFLMSMLINYGQHNPATLLKEDDVFSEFDYGLEEAEPVETSEAADGLPDIDFKN